VQDAGREKLKNYFVLCSHKLVVPAMSALLETKDVHIDGFICPGHVSITIGADAYNIIAEKYGVPCVIAGFEASDILQSIYMLLKQIKERSNIVEVQYSRVVSCRGNRTSQQLLSAVFTVADAQWRGLGTIRVQA
jgi:hydrogenase expression/formation protein HypD